MTATVESATGRLARLLTMVPWLVNRQGIDLTEAAAELGVTPEQVEADLMLLFLCGTPGHMPDDLIEAEWEDGRVYLRNADTISTPLRLNRDEALALIVGLRTLLAIPDLSERGAASRALAKLTSATGEMLEGAGQVQVALGADSEREALALLRGALDRSRRVHLRYLVAARDESTERDVDPMRVVNLDGRWYLEGWCHRAEDRRLFRLDRIEHVEVLDVDGTPPEGVQPRELSDGLFQPSADDVLVQLLLEPAAAWVAEYYPIEQVATRPDGKIEVDLRVTDPTWVVSLVSRLGGEAVVLAPAAVADRVSAAAREALATYDQSGA
ncbi:helix-turn-helix transcriptional regulator [Demetria terragena]|uniref:helix-turn-helix transcriptional regulator n=1 Tax=Demetria terragena TaxID=63959 RepID=UPI00036C68BC|nr:WYL domain-containing protein [Demetria terragena]